MSIRLLLSGVLLFSLLVSCKSNDDVSFIPCKEPDPCDCNIRPEGGCDDPVDTECTEPDPCECDDPPASCEQGNEDFLTVSLDPSTTFQTIESFGASDAWSIQFVGKNWPNTKKEAIAQLLFSTEMDESSNPKGIGLTAWRFNIGGGSSEQGSASNIGDEWRRAESFIDENENYDWTKQEGQQWFLQKAVDYGVEHFTAFVNSPPVVYTKNGKAYSENGASTNLAEDHYQDYADFLMKVLQNLESNTGAHFQDLSPFNEPQWEWKCCGQEGSPWNNDELAIVTRSINDAITNAGLTTKIEVTEAGSLDFLYSNERDDRRNDQIWNFFSSSRETYIGDLENVSKAIAGHSYFTTFDLNTLISVRESVVRKINEVDPSLKFVMSEYTLLEDNEEISGNGRDLGIDPAIYMARVIHADMVYANAVSWQWWLAVSPYDYKDGLVYIDWDKNNGSYYESKLLWGLGNFSRFVRPGMKRIKVTRSDNLSKSEGISSMLQSAYMSSDEIIVVFVNQTESSEKIVLDNIDPESFSTIEMFQTSSSKNLELVSEYTDLQSEIIIGARSIVTLRIK
ncbi:MAG: glycoside hydrolase [Marinoscillum sp.]